MSRIDIRKAYDKGAFRFATHQFFFQVMEATGGGEGDGPAPAGRCVPSGALPSKKVNSLRLWKEILSKQNGDGGMPGRAAHLLACCLTLANAKVCFKVFSFIVFIC